MDSGAAIDTGAAWAMSGKPHNNQRTSPWTEANTAIFLRMLGEGKSPKDIADEIGGGLTRNAVIGKIHRMKLQCSHKPKMGRPPSATRPKHQRNVENINTLNKFERKHRDRVRLLEAQEAATSAAPETDSLIPPEQRKSLLELNAHTCRWPVGNPGDPDFFFCGAYIDTGPYCTSHRRRATQ